MKGQSDFRSKTGSYVSTLLPTSFLFPPTGGMDRQGLIDAISKVEASRPVAEVLPWPSLPSSRSPFSFEVAKALGQRDRQGLIFGGLTLVFYRDT